MLTWIILSLCITILLFAMLTPLYIRRIESKQRRLLADMTYIRQQVELGVWLAEESRKTDDHPSRPVHRLHNT